MLVARDAENRMWLKLTVEKSYLDPFALPSLGYWNQGQLS